MDRKEIGTFLSEKYGFSSSDMSEFLLQHRRNSIIRTKKRLDNFVREFQGFKFEHKAKGKTWTWKSQKIWSKMSEMLQQANWFQVATTKTLHDLGVSDRAVAALRRIGASNTSMHIHKCI